MLYDNLIPPLMYPLIEDYHKLEWSLLPYEQHWRTYHNFYHVARTLHALVFNLKAYYLSHVEYRSLFVAILYHDVIYDLTVAPGENERASVNYAREYGPQCLSKLCLNTIDWDLVEAYILATIHTTDLTHASIGEKLIADFDLLGFDDPYVSFSKDSDLVIREYCSIMPMKDVLIGRLKFLNEWNKKTKLYYTSISRGFKWKSNIKFEIERTEKKLKAYE